jgi:2Fe-2S ferredoxin
MPTVTFEPAHVATDAASGETLFELARRAGVPVETACVGKGTCGLCRVKVRAGEAALSPLGPVERKHLGNVYFITKERLACQARVSGDVTIEVTPPRSRRG